MSDFSLRKRRIQKEINTMKKLCPQVIQILEINGFEYGVFLIHGPLQSPYQGFDFRVKVQWNYLYPYSKNDIKAMNIRILDPIWSPYINKQGQICIDILQPQYWTPALSTHSVLLSITSLLSERHITGEQFLNPLAASQMNTNFYYFFDYAKNQAQKYSYQKKQIYHDQMRSKEEQIKVLEKQDGKIEHKIEKTLFQKEIRQKRCVAKGFKQHSI